MTVPAPSDRRFRRAQVSPAKRKAGPASWRPPWRTVAIVAIAVAVGLYGLVRAAGVVLSADALTVSRITVSGHSRMSRGEVLALLDGVQGESMVTLDLPAWREKLLNSPWVAEAAIRRVLPGTLAVAIAEREPMGIARIGNGLYLIDQRGMVIDEFGPNYAEFDLPIVDGLAAAPQPGGMLIDERRAALAVRLLSDLQRRPHLAQRISQVDVTDVADAAVILEDDTALLRVGTERFAERVQSYLDLAPALRERVPDIDYVDLRFDERVYVKPQGRRLQVAGQGEGGG